MIEELDWKKYQFPKPRNGRDPLQLGRLIQCFDCGEFFEIDDPGCRCKQVLSYRYRVKPKRDKTVFREPS